MPKRGPEEIVNGVTIDRQGTVVVGEGMQQVLCELALTLQDQTPHAVDVEHVLAAVVMAVRDGQLARNSSLDSFCKPELDILQRYVDVLFQRYGANITEEK